MRFVFAPDSFKGSLSSVRLCEILTDAPATWYPRRWRAFRTTRI